MKSFSLLLLPGEGSASAPIEGEIYGVVAHSHLVFWDQSLDW